MSPPSQDVYDTEGNFLPDQAKQAYLAMMERLGYPICDALHTDQFWVCDFVQGDFARLGMGGIFWVNETGTYGTCGTGHYGGPFQGQPFGYLGHEIFLLPGQTLPEHYHLGGPDGYGPKMESWHVRYGDIELFGQYPGSEEEAPLASLPAERQPWGYGQAWFKSRYVTRRDAQSRALYSLKDPESCHGMRAGSQGAIVSEYATYHNHVAFTKPGMVFDNSTTR